MTSVQVWNLNYIDRIARMDEVLNVSNLILHNYGENRYVGSVDIELDTNMTAGKIARLSHRIKKRASEAGVEITSVGISGTNINDPAADDVRDRIVNIAIKYNGIKRLQSFIIDLDEEYISFDIVPDYSVIKRDEDIEKFTDEVSKVFPDAHLGIHRAIDM